jgi:ATP-dependent Clp protease protease subunit
MSKLEKEDEPSLPGHQNDNDGENDRKRDSELVEAALFHKRIVMITGQINDKLARAATERLLALASTSDEAINVFISSPGGHVESGDMIHDVIRFIKPNVNTIGSGWVASAGALIFIAAPRERRLCLPNTRFLIHQPAGGVGGNASEIAIQAEQISQMRQRFNRIFADATGQTPERIAEDTKRDFWLSTSEALSYGLLGSVIHSQSELEALTK